MMAQVARGGTCDCRASDATVMAALVGVATCTGAGTAGMAVAMSLTPLRVDVRTANSRPCCVISVTEILNPRTRDGPQPGLPWIVLHRKEGRTGSPTKRTSKNALRGGQ